MSNNAEDIENIRKKLIQIQKKAIKKGLHPDLIVKHICFDFKDETFIQKCSLKIVLIGVLFCLFVIISIVVNSSRSSRCLVPLNFIIWEATRPLADCSYCANITKPLIMRNITRKDFEPHAYSSKPIIVKNAISHWKAMSTFSYHMFKKLYEDTSGSYESLEDGCQFLNFKTDLFTLKEVFSISKARAENKPGQKPWYVGWGNCHPDILEKVRKFYDIPDFLPEDAEYPATENIFFGYEIGAVMHLDYIPRLMWQGQVKGTKTWNIAPVPECEEVCKKIEYFVEPGDIVLLDTRLWYHSTRIAKGQFSMTVQSEYS